MRATFVDTGAWLALVLRNDPLHSRASTYYRKLEQEREPLIASDYVLTETYTYLRFAGGARLAEEARAVFREAEDANLLRVEWVDKIVADEAWELFINYHGGNLSFTDCTSVIICHKLSIETIFAFDSNFKGIAGIEVIP